VAADMGGPLKNAAYAFGLMMLGMAKGGAADAYPIAKAAYIIMAAIMAGGMVPPLGIALACRVFPKKFTETEHSTWIPNIVMGCSFITEGAIPFAAADPLHTIPAAVAGAGIAGLLSAAFECTLMVPAGGIFVFATVGRPILYVVSWLTGSLVTMFLLGIMKKDVN
ncbi:MAG: PTS fructose transporter subunit IIC, partial [Lachnospiraceae bacterium]|nr:PTS fructose transporter subunit IIC [Lachnospiraceae bacterium]